MYGSLTTTVHIVKNSLLEMQGDNSVLSPHVSVSSENYAKAPTEKHSFDEKKLRFCFVIFASILDIFQSCHSVDLVCWHYFNMAASVYKQCTGHWLPPCT
jgi:hypothetical protein